MTYINSDENTNGSPISARRPDFVIINKENRTCKIVDFAIPADHIVKLKEFKKKNKHLDLAREF